jgi:DNA-binding response OmpR family regulator
LPNAPAHILVVDDEAKIRELLDDYLTAKGYRVTLAATGREAVRLFARGAVDLVLLDLMLPDLSGEEVAKTLRRSSRVPIIMLTAKVTEADQVTGLALGADDYLTKPFSLKVLVARIEAILRRGGGGVRPLTEQLAFAGGDLVLDFAKQDVLKAGRPTSLTTTEYRLLETLATHPGRVYSRNELIDFALGDDFDGFDRAVDSHIKNLRQKIETDPRAPRYVQTVHGRGYKFVG